MVLVSTFNRVRRYDRLPVRVTETGVSQSPYNPSQPYHPSSGVLPCPRHPNSAAAPSLLKRGFAPVAGRTADYTVWFFTCDSIDTGGRLGSFEQRDWYLPVSEVLIVDQYQTPGLAVMLENATLN
jgi:hypothetical protein